MTTVAPQNDAGDGLRIGVVGCGLIGSYVGIRLHKHVARLALIGRSALRQELAEHGASATSEVSDVAPAAMTGEEMAWCYRSSPVDVVGDLDAVIVAVKSGATEAVAKQLRPHLRPGTVVFSFQNGVTNATVLQEHLPDMVVVASMVAFNVVVRGERGTEYEQTTSGRIVLDGRKAEGSPVVAKCVRAMEAAGLDPLLHNDIRAVQWSKLLMNLNNAVNALSGVPVRRMLENYEYRLILAASADETIRVMDKAGIPVIALGTMRPALMPWVLPLPDWIFFKVASAMVKISADTVSSMLVDLRERRPTTEIDFLNGEVVRKGAQHGVPTPVNEALCKLVHDAEKRQEGSPSLSPDEMWDAVGISHRRPYTACTIL